MDVHPPKYDITGFDPSPRVLFSDRFHTTSRDVLPGGLCSTWTWLVIDSIPVFTLWISVFATPSPNFFAWSFQQELCRCTSEMPNSFGELHLSRSGTGSKECPNRIKTDTTKLHILHAMVEFFGQGQTRPGTATGANRRVGRWICYRNWVKFE